jgi:ATP-dependent helicase/nuclease subunit A
VRPLADAEARRLAATEFVRPVILEAGAGTGKTRTLVARLATWLLGPGWEQARRELAAEASARGGSPPTPAEIAARAAEGVVAITFTDAAAAEMAHRIGRLLARVADGGETPELDASEPLPPAETLGERAEPALAAASRLRISTIHGFCHRILSEHALAAGLHPAFRIDADGELGARLASETVRERLLARDEPLVALLAAGIDPPQVLEVLEALADAGVAAAELERDPFGDEAIHRLLAGLESATAVVLQRAQPLRPVVRRLRALQDGLEALERLRGALADTPPTVSGLAAVRAQLDDLEDAARKILVGWPKGTFAATEREALGAAAATLQRESALLARRWRQVRELDPELLARSRAALAPLLTQLQGRRRARGVLSFDELLARAATLLSDRAAVRARVRRGIRQLLVDEFQDTDRRQCELLRQLVLADSAAAPPGLFVVGDPKQSIYGWRSADLAAYAEFLRELDAVGARRGRLEVNFRSVPAVLDEVARALEPVLREEPGIQAGYEPLLPCPELGDARGFESRGRTAVEYWLAWDAERLAAAKPTQAPRVAELEAAAVAREIRELVEAGSARWSDFALLLRSRGDLDVFLEALRRSGVPYAVEKDRSYYRRREIVDAAAAVRAILDAGDLLALVTFLRSPFVGVPDAAWLPLWREGFPAAMIEVDGSPEPLEVARTRAREAFARIPPDAPGLDRLPGWFELLEEAIEAISDLRRDFGALPTRTWIERLRSRLLFEPLAAARFLGRFGVANLERLFAELARRLEEDADPLRALSALRRAVAEDLPAEEARPPESLEDAVSVMTIHTAKGLEFDHVYLLEIQRHGGAGRGTALPTVDLGPPGPERPMVLFGSPTPSWRDHEETRRRVAAAETARLLYVAATRARRRLVLSGGWRPEALDVDSETPSFADLLAPRLAGSELPGLGRPELSDAAGVRWRWVGELAAPPAGVPERRPAAAGAAGEPSASAVRFDPSRADRPRVAAVTAGARTEGAASGPDPGGEPGLGRRYGSALHRALERLGGRDPDEAELRELAAAVSPPELDVRVVERALASFCRGELGRRRRMLAAGELARELPLLVRSAGERPEAPTDACVGVLDLLYRDPGTGETVVADFKSDAIEEASLAERVATYAPQLAAYGEAVRAGLGLPAPPRLELWFLSLDRVVVVPARDSR